MSHHLGQGRIVRIRNDLLPELKEPGPGVDGGTAAEIGLTEGDEGGESGDGVSRKMVRLEVKFIEEEVEKVAGGKSESALEVLEENHPLTGSEYRC